MSATSAPHPILEHDGPLPGHWEHGIVSGSVGITYELPLNHTVADRPDPDIDEKVALVLDIKGYEDIALNHNVDIWVGSYPANRILQNYMDETELVAECESILEACEKAQRWMRTHPGVEVTERAE